ncbi:MAG: prolyl oligopeptidase family serine peptidase [Myxococcales bacterium]|nr:prolyl oligopeptidase family serine peptidase [Myxococcales bacterium]
MHRYVGWMLLLAGCGAAPVASVPEPAPDAGFLEQYAATYRFRNGTPTSIAVAPDAVFYLQSGPRDTARALFVFEPAKGEARRLLTAADLLEGGAEVLSVEEKARRERMRLSATGIARYSVSRRGTHLLIPLSGRQFLYERATGRARAVGPEGAIDAVLSPDASTVAMALEGQVALVDVASGSQRTLVKRGADEPTVTWGQAEFVAQEEMGRYSGLWWSPDSKSLVVQRTDTAAVERFSQADPMDPARPVQPWPYPRPGKANADVRLFLVQLHDLQEIRWDHEAFPYVADVIWPEGAGPLVVKVQDRRQRTLRLLGVDRRTGDTWTLLEETDPAWVELDGQMPRFLADGRFLWTTEREGAWQLELRAASGTLERALTAPALGYRGLDHVDEAAGRLVVRGGTDTTQQHLFQVALAGGEATPLTSASGYHALATCEDGDLAVHVLYPERGPATWTVARLGDLGRPLGALASRAERPGFEPTPEWREVEGASGRRYPAVIVRPRSFEPGRRYPVLLSVYAGPGALMVRRVADWLVFDQWLADHGFILVKLDGRGTPGRGRVWSRAILGDLITVPLEDQIDGLQALGRALPELDLSRVGVMGWSFGGYFSAMAALLRPDVFHAAVAGAPVVDWRDYDTHYTERFLGLPDAEAAAYDQSSALTYADRLARPLLLVHGTQDDNVWFLHALKLSDALFRAGKVHDFLPLSGFTHMVADAAVTRSLQGRILGFFRTHLGGPR